LLPSVVKKCRSSLEALLKLSGNSLGALRELVAVASIVGTVPLT
jgi:hypothetical protein